MTQIVNIRSIDDPRDAIHRACQRLSEGDLVAFPTETIYLIAANPLSPSGVRKLVELQPDGRRSLLLKSSFELRDYVPKLPPDADKLSRRGWPGPLTLALDRNLVEGLFKDLNDITRSVLTANDETVSFRCSGHSLLADVLSLVPAPLIASAERFGGETMPRSAAEVVDKFGDQVAMVFDDGPCRYGDPTSVVRIDEYGWNLAEPGVVSDRTVQRICSEVYLFICTGNTCRSPMAEAIFRRLLTEKLKCLDEELVDRGFNVISAGISAGNGGSASREAVNVLSEDGIDLRNHESQPLTERLLHHADHILTMTRGHRQAILNEHPDMAGRVNLLSLDQMDIPDPYGGSNRDYAACKAIIEQHLKTLIDQLSPLNS